MSGRYHYDLLTIGAGSGGVAASRRAASHGARVAICEQDRVGGTCVIRGCVPKKILMYASEFADALHDGPGYGWKMEGRFDWAVLQAQQAGEVARLERLYQSMLRDAGVELVRGAARLVDAHTVQVGGSTLTAEHILIATGARPVVPDVAGSDLFQTSDDLFAWPELPDEVVIVGGGYIASEFAGILNGLGSGTTVLARGPSLLSGFDADVQAALYEQMKARGIRIVLNQPVRSVKRSDGNRLLVATAVSTLACDAVVAATGRQPNTASLGLEDIGVVLGPSGAIPIDEACRTRVSSVYAVGDVTDQVNLTPVAIAQGRSLADSLFAGVPFWYRADDVPSAVFSQPPVACVGVTEQDAARDGLAFDVYQTAFKPLKNTVSGRSERTMMKLIVERESQRVVGCHMVGRDAPEIMQGVAIAMKSGARKIDFDRTVGIHPTAAEEMVTLRTPRAGTDSN
ncbi:glutathione-disulfide reductase [Ramlibacter sp. WS9]|uniref:glutathione-disulfide reductase n=1 Tax=Ramlibacter sp. WS9 TaxID=1882741 RepID=UPI001141B04F|nr:glutathione-disulfide reductase [Ramlibacter sp. WS9]ROZ78059.1 glutathione-disulfide reductase [Ramlibacter sp. WS9]